MKFQWVIEPSHEKIYCDFIDRHLNHSLVQTRISRNLQRVGTDISEAIFWKVLVGCLLTTQQRSGEGSRVSMFLKDDGNSLLDFSRCLKHENLKGLAEATLSACRLRRTGRIASEIDHAANKIRDLGWQTILAQLETMALNTTVIKERAAARFFKDHFLGIGPKQARNLIQWLGLSRYEIPLDSRVVKVLRELHFPVPLSASALADEPYYCFIEDAIQLMMSRIDVYPCVFDACAFASFEKFSA